MNPLAAILVCCCFFACYIAAPKVINEDGTRPNYKAVFPLLMVITLLSVVINHIVVFYVIVAFLIFIFLKITKPNIFKYYAIMPGYANVTYYLPGFGIVDSLLLLDYYKIVIILFLFNLKSRADKIKLKLLLPDKIIICYFLWICLLGFRDMTVTQVMRFIMSSGLEILAPYFLVRLFVVRLSNVRDAFIGLALSGVFLGGIAFIEIARHWPIYNVVHYMEGVFRHPVNLHTFVRGGFLRATATFGQPNIFGYVGFICFAAFMTIPNLWRNMIIRYAVLGAISSAVLFSFSRGGWVGIIIFVFFFFMLRKKMSKLIGMGVLATIVLLSAMAVSPAINTKVLNLAGLAENSHEAETIDYRNKLFTQSMIVIQRNFLTGSTNFLDAPEMQSLIQGQGIIDLVNSYLEVALKFGVIGLFLFSFVFISALFKALAIMKKAKQLSEPHHRYLVSAFAMIMGTMVVIMTTSSFDYLLILYWSLAGLLTSIIALVERDYADLQKKASAEKKYRKTPPSKAAQVT